jgi:two-component system nitrogen regulation sensor histidine kinase GlnL
MKPPSDEILLESLLDSIDAPVVAVDNEGVVRRLNDAAEGWLGRSRLRALAHPLSQIEPWGAALAPLARSAIAQGMAMHADLTVEGTTLSIAASPWWSEGSRIGAVLLARSQPAVDTHDQRADVATLAAGLAHEVRNPLAALRGAAELLAGELRSASGAPPSTGVREYLDLILRETARVDSLVSRLLSVAKPMPLSRAPFPAGEMLHDLALRAKALAHARGVVLQLEERYDPALPLLLADREPLFEGLLNLVKNAVEALPTSGGRISLLAGLDPDRRRRVNGRPVNLLRLTIRDSGPGLGTTRDRLFTPFFSTKSSGTGLGLLLARRVIESHGGLLTLRDSPAPDGGAEAVVLLPLEGNHG